AAAPAADPAAVPAPPPHRVPTGIPARPVPKGAPPPVPASAIKGAPSKTGWMKALRRPASAPPAPPAGPAKPVGPGGAPAAAQAAAGRAIMTGKSAIEEAAHRKAVTPHAKLPEFPAPVVERPPDLLREEQRREAIRVKEEARRAKALEGKEPEVQKKLLEEF